MMWNIVDDNVSNFGFDSKLIIKSIWFLKLIKELSKQTKNIQKMNEHFYDPCLDLFHNRDIFTVFLIIFTDIL